MTNEELKKILENHKHWLNEDVDGWREMRANFTCVDLEGVDLEGADLRGADLRCANLARADLTNADLEKANLEDTRLEGACLEGAYLVGACLVGANLEGADLEGAYLEGAYLEGANLARADLTNADLRGAYLRGADLRWAENVPFIPMTCPEEGGFIGWKKAMRTDGNLCIIKLHIPEDAKRSSATGRKCRCNKAKVLSIEGMTSGLPFETAVSIYDKSFIYRIGENVEVNDFDEDRFNECAPGIHFFINKQEAIDY